MMFLDPVSIVLNSRTLEKKIIRFTCYSTTVVVLDGNFVLATFGEFDLSPVL